MSTREELDPEGLSADLDPTRATSLPARIYGNVWAFMCSLPRAMYLLMMLGAACFVGMFFDQTLTYEEHAAQWASQAWKLKLFTFLEMNDVFGSWWFVIIIGYLLISITACSIERFPKIWLDALYPKKHLSDVQLKGIKQLYRTTVDGAGLDKARKVVAAIFGRRMFSEDHNGTSFFFLERHRFARFGVYIIHAGLIIIFTGGILVNFTKIDGMMMISEGRNARLVRVWGPGRLPYTHDLGFEIRCEDFRLKTFIDGAPMEFESDLSVYDPSSPVNPVLTKTIQVNDPLEYKGYTFYQASYNPIPGDQRVKLDIGPRGGQRLQYDLAIGEKATMADGTAFLPIETIPDFAGLGAAVRVQQVNADGSSTHFVVFRSYPDFDRNVRRDRFEVQFHGFDQLYATGIQVGRVPFIPWVFLGFLVMFVGMFMAFFLSHRRYWARLTPLKDDDGNATGSYELVVAGAARRHQYAFDEEFVSLKEVLVAAFGTGDTAKDRARALRDARRQQKSTAERSNSLDDSNPSRDAKGLNHTESPAAPTTKEST